MRSLFAIIVAAPALCLLYVLATGCGGPETKQAARDTAQTAGAAVSGSGGDGYFIDPRDGQKYRTVKLGGLVWMAENLNHKSEAGHSWCYGFDDSNCKKYGKLYDWDTAMTACPTGWYLPGHEEWGALIEVAGGEMTAGKALKSRTGWGIHKNGTDDFDFSALPVSPRYDRSGSISLVGNFGLWWSASEDETGGAWYWNIYADHDYITTYNDRKEYGLSVRCVSDPPNA